MDFVKFEVTGGIATVTLDRQKKLNALNGKVLDLAIREAVNNLVNGIESKSWKIK